MSFTLYCSQAKKEIQLKPADNKPLKIYSCGPTIYNYAHIGNLRTFLFNDILRRSLKASGYKVHHAMNLTDIDDKTIAATKKKNPQADLQDLYHYTSFYEKAFFDDLSKLNIEAVEENPRATESIDEMMNLVEILLKKKHAYKQDGSVYFSIHSKKDYGRLSEVNLSDNFSGARYNTDEYSKDSLRDFALWKKAEESDAMAWETSFGRGRPGWHLECSAMIQSIFKEEIDIHTGGVDLMFPHHENEIAQSECAYEHGFVKHWIHCEHLLADGKKMSKSLGNFYTLRDLEKEGFSALAFRYFVLSAHYSQKINFTLQALSQSENAIKKIHNFWQRFLATEEKSKKSTLISQKDFSIKIKELHRDFLFQLQDNLNTAKALASFFALIKESNRLLDEKKEEMAFSDYQLLQKIFKSMNSVLALLPDKEEISNLTKAEELLQQREQARENKKYDLADMLRNQIQELGFEILDTSDGSRLKNIYN